MLTLLLPLFAGAIYCANFRDWKKSLNLVPANNPTSIARTPLQSPTAWWLILSAHSAAQVGTSGHLYGIAVEVQVVL